MQLPPGVTEASFLTAVELVMDKLVSQFKSAFGVTVDEDDLRQQGVIYGIELMAKGSYDSTRPLVSYLYRHIRNRTINAVRDQVGRSDAPCAECHDGKSCGVNGNDLCEPYKLWKRRQRTKSSLMMPERILNGDGVPKKEDATPVDMVETDVEGSDLSKLIDEKLPVDLRQDYLTMLAGEVLSKARRSAVQRAVLKIVDANNGRRSGDHETIDWEWETARARAEAEAKTMKPYKETRMSNKPNEPATNNPADGNTTFPHGVPKPVPTLNLTPPTPTSGFYPRSTPPSTEARDRR